jgi:polysaccharide export outer membrane protein
MVGSVSLWILVATMGCQSVSPRMEAGSPPPPPFVLLAGDEVEISVFGAPDLNTVQRIRADGKMSAKLYGDVVAAGKTPAELQKELIKLYESQLQIKAITVSARSSAAVYVTGAVARPGRVDYLRPMTALEAIMETGGFDQQAGARRNKVRVVRTENHQVKSYVLDLDEIMTKGGHAPYYLKPFDTVYVPGAW